MKTSTNRSRGQFPGPKLAGRSGNSVVVKNKCTPQKSDPSSLHKPTRMLHSSASAKIKLQLFPIDEGTRAGLEKDGCHPYLELTLSSRKKISSVLSHLNDKWGGSKVALGQPVVYPYNVTECFTSKKWTLSDVNVSAGEIYAAIGKPPVFRLRYGWFSNSETKSCGVPLKTATHEACIPPQVMLEASSVNVERTHGEVKQIEETSKEFKSSTSAGATNAVLDDKMASNGLIGPATNVGTGQRLTPWDDSLTNISIGALLSEASLQGKLNSGVPKSNGSNPGLQPSQLISDSFDAFIAAQINCSRGPRPPLQGSSSSILDAEDTCHAFAIPKFPALGKDAQALNGSAYSQTCSQVDGLKSPKHPTTTEVNNQSGLRQGVDCEESETELSLCSRVYNHENSLGLSGIKWTDSLGPFDLSLSSSRKVINGDDLSIGRIVT